MTIYPPQWAQCAKSENIDGTEFKNEIMNLVVLEMAKSGHFEYLAKFNIYVISSLANITIVQFWISWKTDQNWEEN